MAFKFNQICDDQGRVGTFVFLSAEASIVGGQQQRKYADMKLEAEEFLINQCSSMYSAILRPGLVYHEQERPWSIPLGVASNLGHKLLSKVDASKAGPPGTNLRVLVDHIIKEALTSHNDERGSGHKIIRAAEMKS